MRNNWVLIKTDQLHVHVFSFFAGNSFYAKSTVYITQLKEHGILAKDQIF